MLRSASALRLGHRLPLNASLIADRLHPSPSLVGSHTTMLCTGGDGGGLESAPTVPSFAFGGAIGTTRRAKSRHSTRRLTCVRAWPCSLLERSIPNHLSGWLPGGKKVESRGERSRSVKLQAVSVRQVRVHTGTSYVDIACRRNRVTRRPQNFWLSALLEML